MLRELPFWAAGDQTASLSDSWDANKNKAREGVLDLCDKAASKQKIECDGVS